MPKTIGIVMVLTLGDQCWDIQIAFQAESGNGRDLFWPAQ